MARFIALILSLWRDFIKNDFITDMMRELQTFIIKELAIQSIYRIGVRTCRCRAGVVRVCGLLCAKISWQILLR